MKLALPNPALTFIFPKDIMKVLQHIGSYNGAWKHYSLIKSALGKADHQRITVKEFADYEGFDPLLVMQAIKE
jgi:anaerobic glycerol-3-phosphate dehydrogenase